MAILRRFWVKEPHHPENKTRKRATPTAALPQPYRSTHHSGVRCLPSPRGRDEADMGRDKRDPGRTSRRGSRGNSYSSTLSAQNGKMVGRPKGKRDALLIVEHFRKVGAPTANETSDEEFEKGRGERNGIRKGRQ